ncbi:hypothetical protein GGI12_003028 [Dipsacomyces acuminosporus]|nr:hypothetical protein GGI12_003028 [Dipsacomyces acuminosporus]
MIELTAQEQAFGKKLAHVDKEVRDQAVGKLSATLSQEREFSYMDMLRQWKALFYCFWLSDKPLVQQELSWSLANMVLSCKGANRTLFVRAFWETICREWFDIDKHRVDKYLLLVRRVVFFTFRSMEQGNWDAELVREYLDIAKEFPANPSDPKIPNSMRLHMADVYVDELVRLRAGQLQEEDDVPKIPVAMLLEPFMRFIGSSSIRHLPPSVQEKVFESTVIRIAEAEDRAYAKANDEDADSDAESDEESSVDIAHDNEIQKEGVNEVQFLIDSMPEIKKQILAVAGEESMLSLGRKRLHALYQTLCETFPDEESDISFGHEIVVREPMGAMERKVANKFKRKKEKKNRERSERHESLKKERQRLKAIINTGEVDFDVNALENQASAEEERKFRQDIVKIREMEKRAGFGTTEDSGDQPKSKKEKRVQKKKAQKSGSSPLEIHEDVPDLVPITEAAKPKNNRQSASDGAWVVSDKKASIPTSNGQKRRRDGQPSLLAEIEQTIVVKSKKPADSTSVSTPAKKIKGTSDVHVTPKNKAAKDAANGKSSSEKKRLTWALERNSVKRFLKKVPMLPSAEPVSVTPEPKLKSALRKESAYGGASDAAKSPVKPLLRTPTKQEKRVTVNGHASTPAKSKKRARRS